MSATLRQHLKPSYSWRSAMLAYGLYVSLIVYLCLPSFTSMTGLWLTSSAYGHGVLIGPIAIGLIVWRRDHAEMISPAMWPQAIPALLGAALLWMLGRSLDAQIIEHIAIVALLVSGVAAIFGLQITRQWAFPLLFLFFMVPAGESLTPFLQSITATLSTGLLYAAGLNVSLTDLMITTDAGRFHIAEGCSGLRFILAALITGALFGYYALKTLRQRLWFLIAAAFIALAANILRVALVIIIAEISGYQSPLVSDHLILGWFFYAIAIAGLIALGLRLSAAPDPTA